MTNQSQALKRSKKFGAQNQLAFESAERTEREALRKRVGNTPKAPPKKVQPTDAMNSGTLGGRAGAIGATRSQRRAAAWFGAFGK